MTHVSRVGRIASILVPAIALGAAADLIAQNEPAAIFSTKCASCHTYGRGDTVGPDLKGVTGRHDRAWLTSWIRSSERMIRSGDVVAVSIFQKYRQQRMPDHQFSDKDLGALLDYLAAGGPETDRQKALRLAVTAKPQDVESGRDLFFGRRALTSGGAACASCHSIQVQPALPGGSLAPDLTLTYSKYQDKALWSLLERACFPRTPVADGSRPVTEQESFALRAFLRDTARQGHSFRRAKISEPRSRNGR